ncbi:hypothetical protein [Paenibacillus sp. GCM10027626]|uniref:hypothetical protein n=1 Tax=Paenibacillus sp. GCM10027626 TaxID=3273411 RepID=UPI003632FA36
MKKAVFAGFVIIGMGVLLVLMSQTYVELQKSARQTMFPHVSFTKLNIWGFLFGALMEWRALYALMNRSWQIKWHLLLPTVMLMALVLIPTINWYEWYGLDGPLFVTIIVQPGIHLLLAALSGLLMVRAIGKTNTNVS